MKVFVYYNLHRKVWSIKALEGDRKGRVICHSGALVVHGATFKVSEAGRQRVLRDKKKNVHAGVVGWLDENVLASSVTNGVPVTYNPYKAPTFVRRDTGLPVFRADLVAFNGREVNAVGV